MRYIGLVALILAADAAAQDAPIATAKAVTASYNLDSAIAPDGKSMVFIRIIEGREQFFSVGIDGQGEKQLTRDDWDHEDPAISPDGAQLAFVAIGGEGRKNRLMLRDLKTGQTRQVGPADQSPIHPAWMPDGKALLYCTNDDLDPPRKNASEIYRLDLASGRITTVIAGGVNTYPVPSPDGRRIAFRKIIGDMNSEVFVADIDGANARNVTNHESWEGWPAWSPDGRTIAFAGNRNAAWQIFLMNPDGSNLRLLAATEGRGTAPKWTPDGKAVLFTICRNSQERRGCEIYRADVGAGV